MTGISVSVLSSKLTLHYLFWESTLNSRSMFSFPCTWYKFNPQRGWERHRRGKGLAPCSCSLVSQWSGCVRLCSAIRPTLRLVPWDPRILGLGMVAAFLQPSRSSQDTLQASLLPQRPYCFCARPASCCSPVLRRVISCSSSKVTVETLWPRGAANFSTLQRAITIPFPVRWDPWA